MADCSECAGRGEKIVRRGACRCGCDDREGACWLCGGSGQTPCVFCGEPSLGSGDYCSARCEADDAATTGGISGLLEDRPSHATVKPEEARMPGEIDR